MNSRNSAADEYQLGPFKIKAKENLLSSDKGDVILLPKVMTLLVYFCKRPQQVVTFDELIQAVWPRGVVGDNAIYNLIGQLRKALGDSANNPTYIQTVSKVGYRLILNVEPLLPSKSEQVKTTPHKIRAPISPKRLKDRLVENSPSLVLFFVIVIISMGTVAYFMMKSLNAPSDESIRQMQLARYQLYRGDNDGLDQAMNTLQQLIATESDWVIPKLELAYSFIRKAENSAAEEMFWLKKAAVIATDNQLGKKGQRLEEIIKAKNNLPNEVHKLFQYKDALPSARLAYSNVLFAQGKTTNAITQLQLALQQCADCPFLYRKLATAQMVAGNVQEAFSSFSQYRMLINRSGKNPTKDIGYYPLNKKTLSEMANWYFQNPLPKPLKNHQSNALALFHLSLGQVEDAEAVVMSSAANSSHFYDLYTHAAIAGANGDFETSYKLLVKRQRAYPENDLFKLSVVYALWQLDRFSDALDAFVQFKFLPNTQPVSGNMPFEYWSIYAALLRKTGNPRDADIILDKLTAQLESGFGPGKQEASIHLAMAYALQNKEAESLAQLQIAINQGWVSDFNQNWWNLEDSPYFKTFQDNPKFKKIITKYYQGIAEIKSIGNRN